MLCDGYKPNTFLNDEVSCDEKERVVKVLKSNKSVGTDAIPNEILKHNDVKLLLFDLFRLCLKTGTIPSMWQKAIIAPIPKSTTGNNYNPLNYRGISLLSNIGKCFSSFINNRIVRYCNMLDLTHDEQNGFRARRSCTDHIFILNSIIKNNLTKSKSVFCAFVDMEKCFDRIDRNLLQYNLLEFNIDGKLYWCIKSFYENNLSCIRLSPSITTEWFDVTCGVRQGDPLSATLFNIFINDLFLLNKTLNVGVQISDNLNISILLYADDIVLPAENEVNLQLMLSTLEKWCREWKLDVNLKKSNVINFRKKN